MSYQSQPVHGVQQWDLGHLSHCRPGTFSLAMNERPWKSRDTLEEDLGEAK